MLIIDDELVKSSASEEVLIEDEKLKIKEDKKKPKRKKHKLSKVNGKSILDFLSFRRIISEDCIETTYGVTDYYEMEQIAVKNRSKEDKATAIEEFWDFLRLMEVDHKFVLTSNPTDMTENIQNAKRRFAMTEAIDTDYVKTEKKYALQQLEYLNNNYMTDEVYLQIFADNETELQSVQDTVLSTSGTFFRIKRISMARKVKLLHALHNMGDQNIAGVPYTGNDREGRPDWAQKVVDKKGYDPIFISQIQPMGNLKPKNNNCIQTSSGFIKTLHITDYKRKNNPIFYGDSVFKFSQTTSTVDIKNIDTKDDEYTRSLNRSLGEYEDRIINSKDKISRKNAQHEYQQLDNTIDTIIEEDEAVKQIHVRIYLNEPTIEKLEAKEAEIKTKLKKRGFHANCFIDEAEVEYRALFVSYEENQRQRKRKGQEIRAFSLAGSYFFNSAKLIDNNALYSGLTLYGNGLVLINQFFKDRSRKSYGGFYVGNQGFGKSTEIKATAKANRLLGNNSYLFMVSNEAETLVKACGGLHIDARSPKINPMQIYPTDMDIESNSIKEKDSFVTNITKMKIILSMASSLSRGASNACQKLLTKFYNEWIVENQLSIDKITQYEPKQYPLYRDFRNRMERYLQETENDIQKENMREIIEGLDIVIDSYGDIFNSHTAFSLENQKFVAFNLEALLNIQDSEIYNAQYFNLFNMVYSHTVRIGQREKYLYTTGKKEAKDIIYCDIVSDEFHNPIRSENIELLKQMDRSNREGRKIFVGQHYAIHDINDCFPDMGENGVMGPISKAVMNLYKLSTYRFIFRQDSSSIPNLKRIFGTEVSQSDLEDITKLDEGEAHLNIKGTLNIPFKRELSSKDKIIFEGSI